VKKNIFFSLIALLGFVVFWKTHLTPLTPTQLVSFKKPQEYMSQLFISRFTDQGALKETLKATEWAYLPEKTISTLKNPELKSFSPQGTWIVTAQKGQIKQPNLGTLEQIYLEKRVTLNRLATKTITPILIETESLNYYPETQYATSEVLVKIKKPGIEIIGIGLEAFLDKDVMKLLHDVKTAYGSLSQ